MAQQQHICARMDENNQDNYPIVPEFPSFFITPLFMAATLVAVMISRRIRVSNKRYESLNNGTRATQNIHCILVGLGLGSRLKPKRTRGGDL